MAAVYAKNEQPESAIELYLRALKLNRAVGNQPFIKLTLQHLVVLAREVGHEKIERWSEEQLKHC